MPQAVAPVHGWRSAAFDLFQSDEFDQMSQHGLGRRPPQSGRQTDIDSLYDLRDCRFPGAEPAFETPDWGTSFILRGLKSLPITSKC